MLAAHEACRRWRCSTLSDAGDDANGDDDNVGVDTDADDTDADSVQ